MKSLWFIISCVFLMIINSEIIQAEESDEVWRWECVSGSCMKFPITSETQSTALSLGVCKMYCHDFANIWPQPRTSFRLGNNMLHLNRNSISVLMSQQNGPATNLLRAASNRFQKHVEMIIPKGSKINEGGKTMEVTVNIQNMEHVDLTLDTDEGYALEISPLSDGRINTTISSVTFFGARHALETLEQLIVFDDIRLKLMIPSDLHIMDKPYYPYRGILLDTARNFFSVDSIKRTIDAMGTSKLNRFHWHITDSHSFPFVSKKQPNLSKFGSITTNKVYTEAQIQDLVQYALERGVKIIPEFDAPAHVGEGWQGTNLTVCFNAQPWMDYCVEPPCGQLDPTKNKLYDVLEDIYSDMFELFKPDIFHMGGDEVKNACWNSSSEIQSWMIQKGWDLEDPGFFKLWDYFQKSAESRVYKANAGKKIPLILWTSTLTEYQHIDKYLSNKDYIIQVWTKGDDPEIHGLLNKGYKLIMSNYDALYLDCGFGAWVGTGNNWCSPYIGWQKVYDNSPSVIAGKHKNLILGGEAALWSEQADSSSLDNRLWPRAGALAERLWAEPDSDWRSAEKRFLHYRERLVKMGIAPDTIQPEWCYQNEGSCYA